MIVVYLLYQSWFYGLITTLWNQDPILNITAQFTILFMTKWPAYFSNDMQDEETQIYVHSNAIYCFIAGVLLAFSIILNFNCKRLVNTNPFSTEKIHEHKKKDDKNNEQEDIYESKTVVRKLNFANGLFNILSGFLFSLAYYLIFGKHRHVAKSYIFSNI